MQRLLEEEEDDNEIHQIQGVQGTHDIYQPIESVLTHPLAIQCLVDHLNSSETANSIRKHVDCETTCFVESLHNVYRIYRDKRKHYHKTHDARIYLGAMDWNENITREQKKAKISGRKRNSGSKTYKFMDDVVDAALSKGLWVVGKK